MLKAEYAVNLYIYIHIS